MKARLPECQHCHKPFTPDPHNAWHQCFCYAAECRSASKRHSQWKWLKKNVAANCGTENMNRVRDWRKEHPKSSKRRKPHRDLHITATATETSPQKQSISIRIEDRSRGALQDFAFSKQPPNAEITLVVTSALRDFVQAAPGKRYFLHRFRGKPGSNGGRKEPRSVPSQAVRKRKGRQSGWKLLNQMATGKPTLLAWAHCLKGLLGSIARPCWEALAA
jgi:hypothetical protein